VNSQNAIAVRGTLPLVSAELLDEAITLLEHAEDIEIDDQALRASADKEVAQLKKMSKAAEAARKSEKAKPLEECREIDGQFNKVIELIDNAAKMFIDKILAFDKIQAAARIEQQAAVEMAANKARNAMEVKAMELRAQGSVMAATSLEQAAAMVVAPIVQLGPDKSEQHTSKVVTWSAEVADLMKLAGCVAAGIVPVDAILPNLPFLNKRAQEHKQATEFYPGVKAVPTESLRGKRAA
jgi:hypothetical protein